MLTLTGNLWLSEGCEGSAEVLAVEQHTAPGEQGRDAPDPASALRVEQLCEMHSAPAPTASPPCVYCLLLGS